MIFYYTATGNTLAVAQQIQQGLGEEIAGELVSITDAVKAERYQFSLVAGEVLGIAVPCYFFGPPATVYHFLERVENSGADSGRQSGAEASPQPGPVFLITTCGSQTGATNEKVAELLAHQGIQVDYKLGVKFLSNYVPMYTVPSGPKQEQCQATARQEVETFIQAVKADQKGDYNHHKGAFAFISPLAYALYTTKGMKTKEFGADESCTGCGRCQQLCPVSAIAMKEGRPVWVKERCDRCLACYHRCPVNAIQIGKGTKGRGQYLHPVLK